MRSANFRVDYGNRALH
jgi:pilus assembly protein Flp/PilA